MNILFSCTVTQISKWVSLEGITGYCLVQLPIQGGSPEAWYSGLCPVSFWISQGKETTFVLKLILPLDTAVSSVFP